MSFNIGNEKVSVKIKDAFLCWNYTKIRINFLYFMSPFYQLTLLKYLDLVKPVNSEPLSNKDETYPT